MIGQCRLDRTGRSARARVHSSGGASPALSGLVTFETAALPLGHAAVAQLLAFAVPADGLPADSAGRVDQLQKAG